MITTYCLEVLNVTADYSGKPVLVGVELNVARGEIVALIGPNGAGKATLLKSIMGLVVVKEGEIRFNGQTTHNCRPSTNARRGIGYLPQGGPAFVELTVMQNLSIAGWNLSEPDCGQQVEEVLELFPGLRTRLSQRAGVLSGGERQMLGLARSIIGRPKLLLLDEPSTGLHPELSVAVFDKIRELNSRYKTAILIVEQNVRQVLEISSRAYGLKLGRVVKSGESDSFGRKECLRDLFIN